MDVLVLGGGYAGVALARRLGDRLPDDADLTLVDDTGQHLVKHEVHRVVREPSLAETITLDLAALVPDAELREGRVAAVDPDARTVALADGETLSYDACAVCLGATPAFHGIDGAREHGHPLSTVEDALAIREATVPVIEADGRIVVAGAGLSGVQVAGELAAMADARDADGEVLLLERLSRVAPAFDADFSDAIRSTLAAAGVTVRTDAAVAAADADGVDLTDGDRIAHDALVWTGGIAGPAALDGERPRVRSTMQLGESTFVLGDAARVVDADGEAVPASAQAAIREAPAVAANVLALVGDDDADGFRPRLDQFAFDSPGWVVSVGDDAVAQVGPSVVRGRAALALKATVGAGYLSSVGAVRDAVGLVNEELNLAGAVE
jgi:NADH dehydrogenase